MHGRLKVRSTEEQEERKRVEREKKLKLYKYAMSECIKRIASKEFEPADTGLKMSEDILAANPDIHSLWNFRKSILLHNKMLGETCAEVGKHFATEMHLTETCLKKNPKSYGAWHHRQWCLCQVESHIEHVWTQELALCTLFLNMDERNFHCWKHRLFVVHTGNLSRLDELAFTYEKICANFSNYSAWHYRSKLVEHLYYENQIDSGVFEKELTLIENAVYTVKISRKYAFFNEFGGIFQISNF